MKGRSHRLPPSEPPDDWGDGSWTVDCSCGVNFDDGEEMVSCDECGVWVHTRCSRFVRVEASFACHKCKAAKRSRSSTAAVAVDDAEETEVAQLLVELPTKTDPFPPPPPQLPHRYPFRPWAHVPLEERVHVQGIPGGDPALFRGISSVFTSELWRCTGYVPKKFNFQYREFPCWDEEDGENPASRGADVLFSLSKEITPYVPPRPALERWPSPEGVREPEGEKVLHGSRPQSSVKKERSRLHVFGAHSSKRRKDEPGAGKDWSGKKRARGDRASIGVKKRGSTPLVDMSRAGFCNDGGLHVAESIIPDVKSEERREDEPNFTDDHEKMRNGNKPKHILVIKASRGGLSDEALKKTSLDTPVKVEKVDYLEPGISCKADAFTASRGEVSNAAQESTIEEDVSKDVHGLRQSKDENHFEGEGDLNGTSDGFVIDSDNSKPAINDLRNSYPDAVDSPMVPPSNGATSLSSGPDKVEVKLEEGEEKLNGMYRLPHQPQNSIDHCENLQVHESDWTLPSDEQKSQDADKDSEASQQTCDRSDSSELRQGSKCSDELSKLGGSDLSPPTSNVRKLVQCFTNASSSSSAALSRSSGKAIHLTKQQRMKVMTSTVEYAEESMQEVSRQPVKDHPKGPEWSGSKSSHIRRAYVSPSSKASATENTAMLSSCGEATGSSQPQKDSIQVKLTSSGSCQRNEKTNQQLPQSSSKVLSNPMVMHRPSSVNATTTLSDEELALRLHQELNSSPRVSRAPRAHQTAGMQLATPTATSMLKRSSSGGKDQVFRRKSKEESSRDGSRTFRESNDESKKMGRTPSSPDQKLHESGSVTDGPAKKDSRSRSPDTAAPVKKSSPVSPIDGGSGCPPPFEASGQKGLSIQNSPKDVQDDEGTLTCRTLPGLIDEILSKGRCTTYEELCDAVRPHWHNLRKPNGERYAYSSHSHAVLDCLRNRNEWAHLIDRGPKTNSSKRRRKLDSDMPAVESENEEARNKATPRKVEDKNVESQHQEYFPKGKRSRKIRRLKTRDRGFEAAARKTHSRDANSDDDPAAFSHSSNDATEGNFSEDESQGAGQPVDEDSSSSS